MCFDTDSSFLAWTVSYTISWYLFNRNKNYDRWNAGFILCFSTIQLLEAGIWSIISPTTKDKHGPELNDLLTRLVLIVLLTQPLLQTYLGYRFTGQTILGVMSFIFLGIILWAFWRIWTAKPNQFQTHVGSRGHLVWTDSKSSGSLLGPTVIGVAYIIGLFVPLLFMKGGKGYPLIMIGLITAAYSLFFTGPGEFGSYWCFFAVAYAFASLFV